MINSHLKIGTLLLTVFLFVLPITSRAQNCTWPPVSLRGESCTHSAAFMMSAVTYINEIIPGVSQIAYYDNFEMLYREVNTPNWNTLKITNVFGEFRIYGLTPCTKYELKSRTICPTTSQSELSNSLYFETACNKPTNLEVTQIKADEATINYRSFSSGMCGMPDDYTAEVQYKYLNSNWQSVYCSKGQSCKLFLLTPNTKYSVRVRFKYDLNKLSDFTNEVSFTTKTDATSNNSGSSGNSTGSPSDYAIPHLLITNGTNYRTNSTHNFSVNFDNVFSSIDYEISNNLTFTSPLISSSFNTTSTFFSAQFPSAGKYYLRVRGRLSSGQKTNWSETTTVFAINGTTSSPSSSISVNSGASKPDLLYPLKASSISSSSTQLKWKFIEATSYEIIVSESVLFSNPKNFVASTPTLQLSNLKPKKTYYWKVRAKISDTNFSEWSEIYYFKRK